MFYDRNLLLLCGAFLRFELNSFQEVTHEEESAKENGCSMAVFGVTLLCLCLFPSFVGPRLRARCDAKHQIPKRGQIRIDSRLNTQAVGVCVWSSDAVWRSTIYLE